MAGLQERVLILEVIWAAIRDFPNYEVSSDGRVRNRSTGKELKQTPSSVGNYGGSYLVLNLGKGNKRYVHRLVAEAFCDNPDNKPIVNHLNEDKHFNHHSNLEWCTDAENLKHSRAKGCKLMSPAGELHQATCLNEFAKLHGLSSCGLSMLVSCKQKSHKGWTLWK